MKEFVTDMQDLADEQDGVEEQYTEFMPDGRKLRSYHPIEGQLLFLMASMGRGQTDQGRFASIINIMLNTLRGDDKDYFESRLLTGDRKESLPPKQVEAIFEHLAEEWFARPTEQQSDSAGLPGTTGPN